MTITTETTLPIYESWGAVPEGLATKTTLAKRGLRLADGQQPAARIRRWRQVGRRWEKVLYDLYQVDEAEAKREASPAQLEALAKAREAARAARIARLTCKECDTVYSDRRSLSPGGICDRCQWRRQVKQARAEAAAWARELLAGGDFVILDTETADLYGEAIEIAVINSSGQALFNSRLKPADPISPGASAIHKMTAESLANEPTFDQVYEQLRQALTSAGQVIIYNKAFDNTVIKYTCRLHGMAPITYASDCAMEWYAQFFGEWNDYHGDFKWQRLPGGDHTALGDCLATLNVIRKMAAGKKGEDLPEEDEI